MNNENPNQHITEFLNYYSDLTSPQYAVMLKGKWGSGKTHYINEYKKILEAQEKKYIYISLYGVTSYDEIESKFLEILHPKLTNKKTILAGEIAKGLLKDTLNVEFSTGDLFDTEERILIFDDLERCSVDINDLLGYINYFVEHQDYRVILLANEDELKKDKKYDDIKEKLIGKTFEVVSNTELAYNSFIEKLEEKSMFLENKTMIIQIYKQLNSDNLRIFRQVILDFDRFYGYILKSHNENRNLIHEFIQDFFSGSLEYRNEKSKEIDITEPKIKSTLNELLWKDIIEKSIINTEEIEESIQSKYYINNDEEWRKIYYFQELDNKTFDRLILDIEEKLKNKEFKNIIVLRGVFLLLLKLYNIDLYSKDMTHTLELFKDHMFSFTQEQFDKSLYIEDRNFKKHFNYEFYCKKDDEFLEIFSIYFDEVMLKFYRASMIEEVQEILNLLETDSKKLHDTVNKELRNLPILHLVDVEKIIELLISIDKNKRNYFGSILLSRLKEFKEEAIFCQNFKDQIKNSDYSKFDTYKLNLFMEDYFPKIL